MDIDIINKAKVDGLQVSKIFKKNDVETLFITLEKHKLFPTHTSPKDALLLVVEGSINFHIENKMFTLEQHEIFSFKKDVKHHVTANENSKFLIIR